MSREDSKWFVTLVDNAFKQRQQNLSVVNNDGSTRGPNNQRISTREGQQQQQQPSMMITNDMKDPFTGHSRQYIIMNDTEIFEIQNVSSTTNQNVDDDDDNKNFASFFVGRHVIRDGNLYSLNRVDPLFFFLSEQNISSTTTSSSSVSKNSDSTKNTWKSVEQIVESMPKVLQNVFLSMSSSLSKDGNGDNKNDEKQRQQQQQHQLCHVCDFLCNEQTDDELYLKFSMKKTLVWLTKKQHRVYECLLRQDQMKQRRQQRYESKRQERRKHQTTGSGGGGGSISTSFNMEEDDPIASKPSDSNENKEQGIILSDTAKLKLQSVQMICNYLSETLAESFITAMDMCVQDVLYHHDDKKDKTKKSSTTPDADGNGVSKKRCQATSASTSAALVPVETEQGNNGKKQKLSFEGTRTLNNKRLQKVNTKGMKKLSSFFGVSNTNNNTVKKKKKFQ